MYWREREAFDSSEVRRFDKVLKKDSCVAGCEGWGDGGVAMMGRASDDDTVSVRTVALVESVEEDTLVSLLVWDKAEAVIFPPGCSILALG